jgi:hypothetical protein
LVKIGEAKITEDGWYTIEDVRAKKIIFEQKTGEGENATYINQTVYLGEKGLPLRTDIKVVSPTGSVTPTTIFSGKTVTLWVTSNNETTSYTISATENTYEDCVLVVSLSYLPVEVGYNRAISDFSSLLGLRLDVELNVSGKENIQIRNKIVECFVVELEVAQSEQPITVYLRTDDLLFVKQSSGVIETVIKPEFL